MKYIRSILAANRILRIRFFILFLILIYAPLCLNIVLIYRQAIHVVKDEKMNISAHLLKKTADSLNFVFFDVQNAIVPISAQKGIRKTLADYELLNNDNQERTAAFIQRNFAETIANSPYIRQLLCVTEKGLMLSSDDSFPIAFDVFMKSDLYSMLQNDLISTWSFLEGNQGFSLSPDPMLLYIHTIKDLEDARIVGYIFALLDIDLFQNLYQTVSSKSSGLIDLYGETFSPVVHQPVIPIPLTVFEDFTDSQSFYTLQEIDVNGTLYAFGMAPLLPENWWISSVVPVASLVTPIRSSLQKGLWFMVLTSILIAIWIFIEIVILSKLKTQKQMADYRLTMSEELNHKLRIYKHDFMNHLQIIRGLLEINYPEEALEYIQDVTDEGQSIYKKYKIGIPEIESLIFTQVAYAEKHGIEVQIDCIDLSDKLLIRKYDLVKILTNLLKNAIFALETADSPKKTLIIRISCILDEYIFEITNNTPIIPEDLREKIFINGFSTKEGSGSGLGLSIVKDLVYKNHGRIDLAIDEEGNHFILRFPAYKETAS